MKRRSYKDFREEDIRRIASEVYSVAGLIKGLGLVPAGANYVSMYKLIQQYNIDTSHWTGQGWGKNKQKKDWSEYKLGSSLKPHLIAERGHVCEDCKGTTWKDLPIPLELHHIDGDRTNNTSDNLQLLCPNCHAVTDNWRGRAARKSEGEKKERRKRQSKSYTCPSCSNPMSRRSKVCKDCYKQDTKIIWPEVNELKERIKNSSYLQVAKELGVSDNAIRKYLRRIHEQLW